MSVSDAWEQHATKWIAWARESFYDGFWSGTWPTLKGLLPKVGGLTVDLGCGEGRAARELIVLGHEVIGIDRSPTLLGAALGREPCFPVVLGDMTSLPLPDGLAALVVASCSLQDVDHLDRALHETARILCPGGSLCAAIVHPFSSAEDVTTIATDDYAVSEPYLQPRRYEVDFDRGGQSMTFVSMHHPRSQSAILDTVAGRCASRDGWRSIADEHGAAFKPIECNLQRRRASPQADRRTSARHPRVVRADLG